MNEMGAGYMVNAPRLGVRDEVLEKAIIDYRTQCEITRQQALSFLMADMLLEASGELMYSESPVPEL